MRGAVQMQSAREGNGRDDFETPSEVMRRVALVTAPITRLFDPCTSPSNPTGAFVGLATEQAKDGLAVRWCHGESDSEDCNLAYVNPPFSQVKHWAEKVSKEARLGVPIVMLVAARTGTGWWWRLWPLVDACAFWPGRLRFNVNGVPAPHKATFETALLGINVSQRRFRAAFDNCNVVVP
jgi:hypothetical protein